MDAPAVAAAAVAVAVQHAQAAAIEQLLRERERAAMANEDARSYIAQRHFVGSVQVPRDVIPPMTWEAAYNQRHQDLLLAHDAMRAAQRAARAGDGARVLDLLAAELGSESEGEEEAEEEEQEEDEEVEEEDAAP